MIPRRCHPKSHNYRVGNIGSLSWFATVYLELHVGFTSAYGLTLGFITLTALMVFLGKRFYGTNAFATYAVMKVR
jgi:hypothetical protein